MERGGYPRQGLLIRHAEMGASDLAGKNEAKTEVACVEGFQPQRRTSKPSKPDMVAEGQVVEMIALTKAEWDLQHSPKSADHSLPPEGETRRKEVFARMARFYGTDSEDSLGGVSCVMTQSGQPSEESDPYLEWEED